MSILVLINMGIQSTNIIWFSAGVALTGLAFLVYKLIRRSNNVIDVDEINEASWTKMLQMMESERERISSDLHDELGTLISTLYLDVELLSMDSSLSPEAEKRLLEIKGRLNLSADAIRKIVWNLMPDTLEHESLAFALRELCHKLDGVKGTHFHFVQSGSPRILQKKQKIYLFRIVQEMFNNAIKHSHAWHIHVAMHWSDQNLAVEVQDDGIGLERAAQFKNSRTSGNMGLVNIQKRAGLIGAKINMVPVPKGLKTIITLPVKQDAPIAAPVENLS
jgi:two-component system NarL family sensor kinase